MRRFILAVMILVSVGGTAAARTWNVALDGSGDAPTIQAAYDSSSNGDTIVVECGTYYEHDIDVKSGVRLFSQTGFPDCVTIDAQGLGRVLDCDNAAWNTYLVGLTITGGNATGTYPASDGGAVYMGNGAEPHFLKCNFIGNTAEGSGGAAHCESNAAPGFSNCTFSSNHAGSGGGAVRFWACPMPVVYRCTFHSNTAATYGGAIYCGDSSSPAVTSCTFLNNTAGSLGAAVYSALNSQPALLNCLIAFNTGSQAVYAALPGDTPDLDCCDIYGNPGGDWIGYIADQDTAFGNFSADPLFCDTTSVEAMVEECSPCLVGNHPRGHDCGGIIGAWGENCGCGEATEPATWGRIKAEFE